MHMRMLALLATLLLSGSASATPAGRPLPCLVVRDARSGQDLKLEAHGANAVRVRAVPAGGSFKDDPDVVSALSPASWAAEECGAGVLDAGGGPSSVTSGNLRAAVGADGKLLFTRLSDGKVLLAEKAVRSLAPATTTPPIPGFMALAMAFEAAEGEHIYGLGQHAAFPWAKDFPQDGQLDQKGVPAMLLEPHDGDITIPVAHSSLGYAFLSVRCKALSFCCASTV
eukprot:SAG22_NODE_5082_length_1090_cov_1.732593_1_plen_225_part_01